MKFMHKCRAVHFSVRTDSGPKTGMDRSGPDRSGSVRTTVQCTGCFRSSVRSGSGPVDRWTGPWTRPPNFIFFLIFSFYFLTILTLSSIFSLIPSFDVLCSRETGQSKQTLADYSSRPSVPSTPALPDRQPPPARRRPLDTRSEPQTAQSLLVLESSVLGSSRSHSLELDCPSSAVA